jgi:hypothetical protein
MQKDKGPDEIADIASHAVRTYSLTNRDILSVVVALLDKVDATGPGEQLVADASIFLERADKLWGRNHAD